MNIRPKLKVFRKWTWTTLGVIILVAIGAYSLAKSQSQQKMSTVITGIEVSRDIDKWMIHINSTIGYSVNYPDSWEVLEFTPVVTGFAPKDNPYYLEGSNASPILIIGYTGSPSGYLDRIPEDKKTFLTINRESAVKIQKSRMSESFLFAKQMPPVYIVFNNNEALLMNIEPSEIDKIRSIYDSMLRTFKWK